MSFSRRALLAGASMSVFALGAGRAVALTTDDARAYVQDMITRFTEVVRSGPSGDARFMSLLRERIDLPAIGRFAAGLTWRQMNDAQQKRFLDAFDEYAGNFYRAHVKEYNGQSIDVTGATDLGRRGVDVHSRFVETGKQPIEVHWVVSDRSGATKLIDLVVEGVSVSITLRDQFSALLGQKGGDIDAFIDAVASVSH